MSPKLIHCSYHKNLTVYFKRVMHAMYNRILFTSKGYHHFHSSLERFYEEHDQYRISSINNHLLDLDRLGDFRITRFVRDPRDLVISGYFYHKRSAEKWCDVVGPDPQEWTALNKKLPEAMPSDMSYAQYLQNLSLEEGLIAEIEFRERHFDAMLNWPEDEKRIKVFRYEDILGNETETFRQIIEHYGLSHMEKWLAGKLAYRYSASNRKGSKHIRNPKSNQWKEHFTPKVNAYFEERHHALLTRYGYDTQ